MNENLIIQNISHISKSTIIIILTNSIYYYIIHIHINTAECLRGRCESAWCDLKGTLSCGHFIVLSTRRTLLMVVSLSCYKLQERQHYFLGNNYDSDLQYNGNYIIF